MGNATRLFTACAGAVALWAQAGAAYAAGGSITFSGALVSPSCQLSTVMAPGANGGLQGVVKASLCGNSPSGFASTVNVSNNAALIGKGIAQITVHAAAAGTILEVSYN